MKKTRVLLMVVAILTAFSGPVYGAADADEPITAYGIKEEASGAAAEKAEDRVSAESAAAEKDAADSTAGKQAAADPAKGEPGALSGGTEQGAGQKQNAADLPGAVNKAADKAAPEKREVKVYRPCTITSVYSREGRLFVNWKRRSSAEGYRVYRREKGQASWSRMKSISDNKILQYRSYDVANGKEYEFKVLKYNTIVTDEKDVSFSKPAKVGNKYSAFYTYLSAPKGFRYSKKENCIYMRWDKNTAAESYVVMCSRNSLFKNAKIRKTGKTNLEIKGVDTSKSWYISVRCVKGESRSDWRRSANYSKGRTAKISYLTRYKTVKVGKKKVKRKVRLDVRIAARQRLYGYDTVQGAASGGKYSYTILLNKSNGYSKIVKMKGGTSKVVRVSKAMYLGHGNGMTYNPHRKTLVVAHGASTKGVLSVVRARDLRYMKKVRIRYGKSLTGYNGSKLAGIKTYSGVAYLPGKRQYLLTPNEKVACVYLDKNFKPIRYQTLYYKFPNQTQGSHAEGELLFRSASPKGSGPDNAIFVYDAFGQFLKKIRVPVPGELESLYYIGSKLYGAIYRSRFVTRTKTVKQHYYVYKHGKRIRRTRNKKVKYSIFYRDSYVIRIRDY